VKEVFSHLGFETQMTEGLDKCEPRPVFVEGGRVTIGQVKGAALKRSQSSVEIAQVCEGGLVAVINVNGRCVVVLGKWDILQGAMT